MNTLVHLKLGTLRGGLSLARTPLYLRFVMQGSKWETLDALDQPEDVATEAEKLYAAIKVDSSNVHVDGIRNGKRFGEWHKTATYKLVDDQPSQEMMRDYVRWCEWCMGKLAEEGTK